MTEEIKVKEMSLADFGIGMDTNIQDRSTDELHDLLNKARSKVFDTKGKVIRQTLSEEEKVAKKLSKLMADPTLTKEEKMDVLAALKKSLIGKEEDV